MKGLMKNRNGDIFVLDDKGHLTRLLPNGDAAETADHIDERRESMTPIRWQDLPTEMQDGAYYALYGEV